LTFLSADISCEIFSPSEIGPLGDPPIWATDSVLGKIGDGAEVFVNEPQPEIKVATKSEEAMRM
jgi:hypothetical protein